MSNDLKGFITTKEAARRANVSRWWIRALIHQSRLYAVRMGREWLVDEKSLRAFLLTRRTRGRPKKVIES